MQVQLSVAQAFLPVKTCPKACFSSFGEDLRLVRWGLSAGARSAEVEALAKAKANSYYNLTTAIIATYARIKYLFIIHPSTVT